eukprot:jgi/Botrbrau1/11646/Bobra.168_2s0004.2
MLATTYSSLASARLVSPCRQRAESRRPLVVSAAKKDVSLAASQDALVFRPFEEVKPQLAKVEETSLNLPSSSFARVDYETALEGAVNEQINVEYNISYVYHSLFAYFDRDNVGLPGLAKYFQDQSEEEREHAQKLMSYQNRRGGRVKLHSILMPEMEFDHPDKGDALYAMELSLSLEKLNFQKLEALYKVASAGSDAEAENFIQGMLDDQAKDVKKTAEYVAQLRRVGKGLGVFEFDRYLSEGDGA